VSTAAPPPATSTDPTEPGTTAARTTASPTRLTGPRPAGVTGTDTAPHPGADARPATGPGAWPGLEPLGTGPVARARARVAAALFRRAVAGLPVTVDGDGPTRGAGGPRMVVVRPDELYARLGRDGLIGFGEAYLTGAWDADDPAAFLTVLAGRAATLVPAPLQRFRGLVLPRAPRSQRGTLEAARQNVSHHYDLSNAFYARFLDATMSYSSALFPADLRPARDHVGALLVAGPPGDEDLESAQARKIERLLDATGVGPGTRVLEIGTGWGELALRAARRGATVHTVTLSREQRALALERIAAAGVADRVDVGLRDYREVTGTYDAVLSVEMIEAVGHHFWPAYFRTLDARLAPGGRVGLQAITMPDERLRAVRDTRTWITKHVFPGGSLPSTAAIDRTCRRHTDLRIVDRLSMGAHYAETLRRWEARCSAAASDLDELGFDARFRRLWRYYLDYSRAGFASGYIDVQQIVLAREGDAR